MPADTITILCVHCAAKLKVPPASAPGKKGRCPKCGTANDIPVAEPQSRNSSPSNPRIQAAKSRSPAPAANAIASTPDTPANASPAPPATRRSPSPRPLRRVSSPPSPTPTTPRPERSPPSPTRTSTSPTWVPFQCLFPAPLDAATATTCPNCQHPCDPEAKICINCGTNLKTGRRLLTKDRGNIDHEAHEVLAWLSWVSLIIPVSLAPYRSTVAARRTWPFTKILITFTVIISGLYLISIWTTPEPQTLEELIALADSPTHQFMLWPGERFQEFQLITHIFLHGGLAHLAGNMIFLAAFGVAIYQALGWFYPLIYLALGVFAGLAGHLMLSDPADPVPLLGASGAIAGVSGMYLVLFPRHDIHMVFWFRFTWLFEPYIKTFAVTGIFVVLFYTSFDVLNIVLQSQGNVAHGVHIAGFSAGVVLGFILLITRAVKTEGYDLLTWVFGNRWRPRSDRADTQ
ncbi:MAG: hypothetical protein CMJ49_10060 [Planctomycetaceae bacterium]|nr:hypothetical protein [Planctomycetaceae bacterium]